MSKGKKGFDLFNSVSDDADEQQMVEQWHSNILGPAADLMRDLGSYVPASLGPALTEPTEENMQRAWSVVYPNVQLQFRTFDFADKIFTCVSRFYRHVYDLIPKRGSKEVTVALLARCPTVARSIVEAFDLCIRLDVVRCPLMSNDLAYFRRNAGKFNVDGGLDNKIERSARLSIWLAQPTPFLSGLSEYLAGAYPKGSSTGGALASVLLLVVGIVSDLVKGGKLEAAQVAMLSRAMAGGLVLASRFSEGNIFSAKAKPKLKPVVEVLVGVKPKPDDLIALVRTMSVKIGDSDTDPKLMALLRG